MVYDRLFSHSYLKRPKTQEMNPSVQEFKKTYTAPSNTHINPSSGSQTLEFCQNVTLINHSRAGSQRVKKGQNEWMSVYVSVFPPVWGKEMVK